MATILGFPQNPNADNGNSDERASEVQAVSPSSTPLLDHLNRISNHAEVQEVIQLLRDIRDHQDHEDMKRAFKENDHALARGAQDRNNDLLDLLIADYLRANELEAAEAVSENHQIQLEAHVKYGIIGALKGYHEVVKNIRSEISSIASRLEEDGSVQHVRELVAHLKGRRSETAVQEGIQRIATDDSLRHFFYFEDSEDVHLAMAKAAHQEGHRNHEAAAAYVADKLHERLNEHFGEALNPKPSQKGSGAYEIDLSSRDSWGVDDGVLENQAANARREKLLNKLRSAAYGTPAEEFCQLLRAASANFKTHPLLSRAVLDSVALHSLIERFSSDGEIKYDAVVDAYLSKYGDKSHSFDDYIGRLVAQIKELVDPKLYRYLECYSSRPTMAVSVAPPSVPVPDIPPPPALGVEPPTKDAEAVVIREVMGSVFRDETHVIAPNRVAEIVYAMPGSTIEVGEGSTLRLHMADDGVTIKLGKDARVQIEQVGNRCTSLRILNENGRALTGAEENVELGEGIQEKLSA